MSVGHVRESNRCARPTVRFVGRTQELWRFVGARVETVLGGQRGGTDLNVAVYDVIQRMAQQLEAQDIAVELWLNPAVPRVPIAAQKVEDVVSTLVENAAAAVESGSGVVVVRTWQRGRFAGVDAVGKDAQVPPHILEHLMDPGYSTKAAPWDTGFGLFSAVLVAKECRGDIDLFQDDTCNGIGFRLSLPLRVASSPQRPEMQTSEDDYSVGGPTGWDIVGPPLFPSWRITSDAEEDWRVVAPCTA